MPTSIILSRYQAQPILDARKSGIKKLESSLDLGVTKTCIEILDEGIKTAADFLIPWDILEKISQHEVGCFEVHSDGLDKIQLYSELMSRVYTLMPTPGPPTMLVSGLPMHRIKATDPHKDTLSKIAAVKPVHGAVLDTTTGLGYTAIEAAKSAESVITVELDPAVVEICRRNPWSKALFSRPNIERRISDVYDEIERFDASFFSRIIHDPPTFSLAGDLYSGQFYSQLYRVLKAKGRLYHYVGDPSSRSGHRTTIGVVQRLRDAGFKRVETKANAFGVVAYK
ncbi:MAG: class I SAM-dependent methyltransferase [Candidatus Promineifilaceae bacterium]